MRKPGWWGGTLDIYTIFSMSKSKPVLTVSFYNIVKPYQTYKCDMIYESAISHRGMTITVPDNCDGRTITVSSSPGGCYNTHISLS